jgi:hypothetical protein
MYFSKKFILLENKMSPLRGICLGKPEERVHLKDLGLDGRILKWTW